MNQFPSRYRSKCRAAQRMRIIRALSLKIIANSKTRKRSVT